jgi:hypothetical protein
MFSSTQVTREKMNFKKTLAFIVSKDHSGSTWIGYVLGGELTPDEFNSAYLTGYQVDRCKDASAKTRLVKRLPS